MKLAGRTRPAQTRKVAANQAWFEYLPARVVKPGGPSLDRFDPPAVADAPIARFDEHGLGQEQNNLAAIGSLTAYRSLRWGRNVDVIITDQHSYRSEEPGDRDEAKPLWSPDFPNLISEEALEILDAGRAYQGARPPASIRFGDVEVENFRKDGPPQTILGAEQKAWFLDRLRRSTATWKIWGCSLGTLDWRADPQNLPAGLTKPWPSGYASFGGGDHSAAYLERAEIYDAIRDAGITGFATVAGDRHSFWAGLAAKALPPQPFDPIGVAFITGSVSAPTLVGAGAHRRRRTRCGRCFSSTARRRASRTPPSTSLIRHGVRSCLEFQKTAIGSRAPCRTRALAAPVVPGHGRARYATVRSRATLETDFV